MSDSGCTEYDTLVGGLQEARQQVKSAGKQAVAALFKKLFTDYPAVQAIGWTQYTPHFNDGEPCEFSVHGFYVSLKVDVDWSKAEFAVRQRGRARVL